MSLKYAITIHHSNLSFILTLPLGIITNTVQTASLNEPRNKHKLNETQADTEGLNLIPGSILKTCIFSVSVYLSTF